MTAANPVVPDSAVEAARREFNVWWFGSRVPRDPTEAMLAAALPDLIAANTDDTKADALEEAADNEDVLRVALDSMLDSGNARLRAAGGGNRIFPPALEDDLRDAIRLALRDRAAALRTDTTHKETP